MWRLSLRRLPTSSSTRFTAIPRRSFHATPKVLVVKPFLLADIGEGIRECEVIQWFVTPGTRVEQFEKLCEVQSDKASVEITSRFDGVIMKLYHEPGDMALVGKPLVDIDVDDDIHDALLQDGSSAPHQAEAGPKESTPTWTPKDSEIVDKTGRESDPAAAGRNATLATPAVRRICKELGVDLSKVTGTGKDGRVLKEDVARYDLQRTNGVEASTEAMGAPVSGSAPAPIQIIQEEQTVPLSPIQAQMFKTMTASLSIPQFLYSDEVSMDDLASMRATILSGPLRELPYKVTYTAFIIKAVSMALEQFPLLNSRILESEAKPLLVYRKSHNIGVAMDTESGLIVPNIKSVQNLSVLEVASEVSRLAAQAREKKLQPSDLRGGTITVSNIGSIGGTVVSPVIVPGELAILGIGQAKVIPAFNESGEVVRKTVANFSWSADHRVVDGATVARMAAYIKRLLESPGEMLVRMK